MPPDNPRFSTHLWRRVMMMTWIFGTLIVHWVLTLQSRMFLVATLASPDDPAWASRIDKPVGASTSSGKQADPR